MQLLARQASACLVESRPAVLGVVLLRFLATALPGPALNPVLSPGVAVAAAGWICATMSIYIFNGIADRKEDIANASTRPIASGRLPVRTARTAVVASAVISMLCALQGGTAAVVLSFAYLMLGFAYSGPPFPLKQTYYTCTGAGAGLGLATYAAGLLANSQHPGIGPTIVAGTMTLWMGCVGSIAKEFSDVDGDRAAGRCTWPMVLGDMGAKALLTAIAGAIAVGLTVASALCAPQLIWCALTVILGAIGVTVTSREAVPGRPRKVRRRPYHAFMVTQIATHLVLLAIIL
ncbi:UbiA family prenyltransferase [Streptomyces phaeolivaceus]|nr:UbiA family prenyltransferase [Streptomyces phaeolivaceus]